MSLAPDKRIGGALLCAGWVAALLAAPLAIPLALELRRHGMPRAEGGSDVYALDLVSVLVPSPFDPLTRPLLAPFLARFPGWYDSVERVGTVGIVSLALAGVAGLRAKAVRPWVWFGGLAWLLSLGPSLRVLGTDTHVPLPAAAFSHVPGLDQFRAPSRFQVLTVLALAILVPAGAQRLCAGVSRRARSLIHALAFGVIALELLAWPAIEMPLHVPGFVRALAARPDARAVHVLASEEPEYVWMYWQTLFHKRLLLGKAARIHPERARAAEETVTRLTQALQPDASGRYAQPEELRATFTSLGVGYLVVSLKELAKSPRLAKRYAEMVAHLFPSGPAFQDEEYALFAFDEPG
jgi:hypothetical protein